LIAGTCSSTKLTFKIFCKSMTSLIVLTSWSGDVRGAHLDSMDADQLLRGESYKPAKNRVPDEECSAKQVFHRSVEGSLDKQTLTKLSVLWLPWTGTVNFSN
jgi:hypothetical protein